MFKLLMMLVTFLGVGMVLLGLRQRRLELTSESVLITQRIRDRNETVLDQRVAIAKQTNPWALVAALRNAGVNTGAALQPRNTQLGQPAGAAATGGVETDLLAPVMPH